MIFLIGFRGVGKSSLAKAYAEKFGCEIYDNHAYNNSLGIFVPVLPQLQSKASRNTRVYNNLVENNNLPNFAEENMMASMVPAGIGILSLGADDMEVYNNTVTGHRTVGIAVFGLLGTFDRNEIDVGPNPDNNYVHDNRYDNNGYDPVEEVKAGFEILKSLELRHRGVNVIACPTCGRVEIDVVKMANEFAKLSEAAALAPASVVPTFMKMTGLRASRASSSHCSVFSISTRLVSLLTPV